MDMQELTQPNPHHIQTPIKKKQSQFRSQLKTAESSDLPHCSTLKDIDPQELFQKFHQIVNVTEVDEHLLQPETIYRKIQFESQTHLRLNFDESSASMRKKNRQKCDMLREDCEIKPFMLLEECKKEEQELLGEKKEKKDQGEVRTPRKKGNKRKDLWLAARKEDPFRDLSNQKC